MNISAATFYAFNEMYRATAAYRRQLLALGRAMNLTYPSEEIVIYRERVDEAQQRMENARSEFLMCISKESDTDVKTLFNMRIEEEVSA